MFGLGLIIFIQYLLHIKKDNYLQNSTILVSLDQYTTYSNKIIIPKLNPNS